jgi:hypothetical protein
MTNSLHLRSLRRRKKYQPVLAKPEHGGLVREYNGKAKELWVGPMVEKGKNLPSKKNLADYIDERGHMQLLPFSVTIRNLFPPCGYWFRKRLLVT